MKDYRILLVEDDIKAAEIIIKNLVLKQFDNIKHAADSIEAEEIFRANEFDIILMDIQLPGGRNGIQLAQDFKELNDTPVIFITANNVTSEYEHIIKSNPYGFISKPIKVNDLVISMDICIERHRVYKQVKANEDKLKLATQVLELLNQANDSDDVITDILFIIKEYLELKTVGISLNDSTQHVIDSSQSIRSYDNMYSVMRSIITDNQNTDFTETRGGSVYADNIKKLLLYKDKQECENFVNILFVPLRCDKDEIGILFAVSDSDKRFEDEMIRFLERISNSIGLSINRKISAKKIRNDIKQIKDLEDTINNSPTVAFQLNKAKGYEVEKLSDSISKFELERENVVGNKFSDIIDPNSMILFEEMLLNSGSLEKQHITLKIVSHNKTFWADCYFWQDETNEDFIKGVFHDVSKRFRAEESLKSSQEFLRSILTHLNAAIIIIDNEKRVIVDANEHAAKLIGMTKDELTGQSCKSSICKNRLITDTICKSQKNIINMETKLTTAQDEEKIVKKSVIETIYKGKPHHVIIFFDVTEEKQQEQQLVNMRRLESIGQLAAGVAHEINTPTQYIGDNIFFLSEVMEKITEFTNMMLNKCERKCDSSKEIREKYNEIDMDFLLSEIPNAINQSKEGVQRVAEIVSAMKKFSHPGSKEKSLIDLHEAIENTLIVTRSQWKYFADISKDYDENIVTVPCYSADLNQAFLNLIVNSAQAIDERLKNEKDMQGLITVKTYTEEGNVVIEISDNGSGIPDSAKDKVFDPFFTTKDIGKGTGQGLSIVHSIIHDKHQGEISFTSTVGEGTTFKILLPMEN